MDRIAVSRPSRIGYKARKRHVEITMTLARNLAVEYSFQVGDVLHLPIRLGDTWLDCPLITLGSSRVRWIYYARASDQGKIRLRPVEWIHSNAVRVSTVVERDGQRTKQCGIETPHTGDAGAAGIVAFRNQACQNVQISKRWRSTAIRDRIAKVHEHRPA